MSPLDLLFYEVETGMRYVEVPAGEDVADPLSRTASAGSARFRWVRVAEPVAVEDDFCLLHYKMFKDAAGRTAKSILVSCNTRMEPFAIPQVRELVSYDEMELDKLGDADCRRAVFAIVSDTSGLYSFLLAIMMWQAVNVLCRRALSRYGGALPTHVSFLLDEFANIGRLPDIERTIAVVRSRNVSVTVYLQSMSQLKSRYKDDAATIVDCCDTTVFLGGKSTDTVREISEAVGKETAGLLGSRETARGIEEFDRAALVGCEPAPEVYPVHIPVTNLRGEEDCILVLEIGPSSGHVISRRSDRAVFLRQKDSSVELERDPVLALEYDKNQRRYEDEVQERSSMGDVDPEVMSRYKTELGTEASDELVLRSCGFLQDGHLTNAGVLLFSENPARFMPWARVRVIRLDGSKMETGRRLNIVKDRTFDGPLPKTIEGAKEFISSQLREFQYLGADDRFKVIPEYPEFAWFEGLVNAVTHRDYAMSGDHIRVMMYDDRLEITSPGKLPNIVTLENMKYTRRSRNPTIARTLVEFGWVRELNEGVQRIYDEMASFFLREPTFSEPNGASVRLTLENSATSRVLRRGDSIASDLGEDVVGVLGEYERAALQYVYGRGRVTVKELVGHLGRSAKGGTRGAEVALEEGYPRLARHESDGPIPVL